jgi:hypothetical protein
VFQQVALFKAAWPDVARLRLAASPGALQSKAEGNAFVRLSADGWWWVVTENRLLAQGFWHGLGTHSG